MASNSPTGTITDRFMMAPSAIRSSTKRPAIIVGRRLAQDPGKLIRHQNGDQNAGDGQPGLHHLAQHISLHGPFHGAELRAFALI